MAVNFRRNVESNFNSLILSYNLLLYLTLCSIPPSPFPFSIFFSSPQKVLVQRTLRGEVPMWSSTAAAR